MGWNLSLRVQKNFLPRGLEFKFSGMLQLFPNLFIFFPKTLLITLGTPQSTFIYALWRVWGHWSVLCIGKNKYFKQQVRLYIWRNEWKMRGGGGVLHFPFWFFQRGFSIFPPPPPISVGWGRQR